MFQLPSSVAGSAIGVILYSILCLACSVLLTWLCIVHNERVSYIACISYLALLATLSSLIQQIYDFSNWQDLTTAQFYRVKEYADDAEVQYQEGVTGFKLAMAYIRMYCFTAESTLIFFLSLTLAATVQNWWARRPQTFLHLSIFGKILAICAAALSTGLLHTPLAWHSFTNYMIIANAQFLLSVLGAAVMLVVILVKYVQTRRTITTWRVQYPLKRPGRAVVSAWSRCSIGTKTGSGQLEQAEGSRKSTVFAKNGTSFADNWLVVRLTFSLIMLCVFEFTQISSHLSAHHKTTLAETQDAPDLSAKAALDSVRGYLQGVSPSLVLFIVFGTTRTFRVRLWRTFVPRRWRREGTRSVLEMQGRVRLRESQRRSGFIRSSSTGGGGAVIGADDGSTKELAPRKSTTTVSTSVLDTEPSSPVLSGLPPPPPPPPPKTEWHSLTLSHSQRLQTPPDPPKIDFPSYRLQTPPDLEVTPWEAPDSTPTPPMTPLAPETRTTRRSKSVSHGHTGTFSLSRPPSRPATAQSRPTTSQSTSGRTRSPSQARRPPVAMHKFSRSVDAKTGGNRPSSSSSQTRGRGRSNSQTRARAQGRPEGHARTRSNSSTITTFPTLPETSPCSPLDSSSSPSSTTTTTFPAGPSKYKTLPPAPRPGSGTLRRGRSISVDEFGRPVPNFSRKYSIDIVADPTAISVTEENRKRPRTGSASQREVRDALVSAWRESVSYKWAEETLRDLKLGERGPGKGKGKEKELEFKCRGEGDDDGDEGGKGEDGSGGKGLGRKISLPSMRSRFNTGT